MNMTATATANVSNEMPNFEAIKTKQNAAWSSGDYAIVGTTLQIVGEELAEALDVRSGHAVLDVAAGNGNFTLAAARRWANVTSTDYVTGLLERGAERARADRLDVSFHFADAEDLPFGQGMYDVVASTYGVMFTPNQEKAAAEMMRVCRSGGRIGMANWTPDGFVGAIFKLIGRYVPPPQGVKSPALWGTQAHLEHLFGAGAREIRVTEKQFVFRYRSPEHFMEIFRTYYGPVHKAFGALDTTRQAALHAEFMTLIDQFNVATDGTLVAPSTYLEVVIERA